MNWKAVRNYVFMAVAAAGLLTLTACGGGGGGVVQPPPPVGNFTNANLINNYAFFYQGSDAFGAPLAVSGQFIADGAGHITSGLIDIEDESNTLPLVAVQILSTSTYTVAADGQTTAQINFQGGAVTWQFTLASSEHALMTQFDVLGSGSGTIDRQDPTKLSTALIGNFAFNVSGVDFNLEETTVGGNLLVNAGGGIPSTQSVFDFVQAGVIVDNDDTGVNGSLTPDPLNPGHGQITIATPNVHNLPPLVFSY
jgi:hypothetical protein